MSWPLGGPETCTTPIIQHRTNYAWWWKYILFSEVEGNFVTSLKVYKFTSKFIVLQFSKIFLFSLYTNTLLYVDFIYILRPLWLSSGRSFSNDERIIAKISVLWSQASVYCHGIKQFLKLGISVQYKNITFRKYNIFLSLVCSFWIGNVKLMDVNCFRCIGLQWEFI
jgi:hypothetical protein